MWSQEPPWLRWEDGHVKWLDCNKITAISDRTMRLGMSNRLFPVSFALIVLIIVCKWSLHTLMSGERFNWPDFATISECYSKLPNTSRLCIAMSAETPSTHIGLFQFAQTRSNYFHLSFLLTSATIHTKLKITSFKWLSQVSWAKWKVSLLSVGLARRG